MTCLRELDLKDLHCQDLLDFQKSLEFHLGHRWLGGGGAPPPLELRGPPWRLVGQHQLWEIHNSADLTNQDLPYPVHWNYVHLVQKLYYTGIGWNFTTRWPSRALTFETSRKLKIMKTPRNIYNSRKNQFIDIIMHLSLSFIFPSHAKLLGGFTGRYTPALGDTKLSWFNKSGYPVSGTLELCSSNSLQIYPRFIY